MNSISARPLRTVQVVNVRWFNGTAWYGINLAAGLNRAGHETLVLGLPGTQSFARAQAMGLKPAGLPLTSVNPFVQPILLASLFRILGRFKPDIVNCHRGEAFVLFALLKKALGFKLVRTRGDQRLPKNSAINRALHSSSADAVIATNSRIERYLTHEMHVPKERMHRILGGVDTAAFAFDAAGRERIRAEFGFSAADVVLGLVGRLDLVKGQKELIEAVSVLRAEGLPVRLLLLGHSSILSEEETRAYAEAFGMSAHTALTGMRPDVAACISAMDIGVTASLYSEAIARAALEIMACGRPLLGTDVGVMPDLLLPEALCAPADVRELVNLLRRGITDFCFRETLVRENERRMRALSMDRFVDSTLEVYRHCFHKTCHSNSK
jgi:glycosyltransferase involved in cell wall biosynthesis